MTIPNENRRCRYEGNGSTTQFTFDFKANAEGDLLVVRTDPGGREIPLELGVDYSVSGAGSDDGGFVAYPLSGPPLPQGSFLTIVRALSFTQEVDLQNQGPWLPEVVEGALDRLTILTQQLLEQSDRSLRFPVGAAVGDAVLPSPSGPALLAYSAEGNIVTMPVSTQTLPRENVYTTGADTTGGYLSDKLSSGTGIELAVANPGGFESLTISSPFSGRVTSDDLTPGYLAGKVEAGDGVEVTVGGAAGDEKLVVASMGRLRVDGDDEETGYLLDKVEAGACVEITRAETDGAARAIISLAGAGARRVTVFTGSGTYAKPSWLKYAEVYALGGGGGGRYGSSTAGGGGGCAVKLLDAASIGAVETVTVGAGGAGGTSGASNGGNGSASSFGSHCSGNGGSGTSGAGGTATGGYVNLPGGDGQQGVPIMDGGTAGYGGQGAGPFGGASGKAYGGGGNSGSANAGGNTDGSAGAGGIVVVKEYSI